MSSEVETSLEISGSRRIPRFFDSARNDKAQQTARTLFADLTIYHDESPHLAAMNMAIDEALLETAVVPTIRFYRWRSPALSFGYFGKFSDVATYAAERDLVRRWTGGGIVFHGEDLTYSIVIPASDPVFDESSIAIYEKIHRALCGALAADGQDAELASVAELCERRKSRKGDLQIAQRRTGDRRSLEIAIYEKIHRALCSALGDHNQGAELVPVANQVRAGDRGSCDNNCFANPVRADVMMDGRKIAGAAQRRTRRGLLQQGSIQGFAMNTDLAQRFAQALSANCSEFKITKAISKQAQEVAQQKYGTESWLRKR
jgi:lipoate-protein ligase A